MYNLRMSIAPEELTASQARNGFARVIGQAEHAGTVTYITNHGRRVAAVVPVEAVEALERLEDEALSAMARKALAEPGEAVSHDEVLAQLDL
jgi:prevent-host-death family protein